MPLAGDEGSPTTLTPSGRPSAVTWPGTAEETRLTAGMGVRMSRPDSSDLGELELSRRRLAQLGLATPAAP
jgi:hypothetical protein